jgi:hypothetical protein
MKVQYLEEVRSRLASERLRMPAISKLNPVRLSKYPALWREVISHFFYGIYRVNFVNSTMKFIQGTDRTQLALFPTCQAMLSSACPAYCGKHNYGTIKRQWNFHYIITKKGKDRASSDVGFMFVAYNLRRIFNLVDQEALKKYLKMLWLCFLAILDYLRAIKKLLQRCEIYRFHNYQFLQPHPNSRKWAYI